MGGKPTATCCCMSCQTSAARRSGPGAAALRLRCTPPALPRAPPHHIPLQVELPAGSKVEYKYTVLEEQDWTQQVGSVSALGGLMSSVAWRSGWGAGARAAGACGS